jgi:hypothetical protein
MFRRTNGSVRYACVLLACLMAAQLTVQAGPPLICHPYTIGDATSLPWSNGPDKFSVKSDYEVNNVVNDTLALLKPDTPIIVRMETLRRATIYTLWHPRNKDATFKTHGQQLADELLAQLLTRMPTTARKDTAATLAMFDAGYLLSSYRQSGWQTKQHASIDAYALVRKAAEQSGDATMEFAAALSTPDKASRHAHLQKALANASEGSLLARNLVSHFGGQSRNLADMRANLSATQQ